MSKAKRLILTPRCYVRGELVVGPLVLFALSKEVDRVFIVSESCAPRIDDAYTPEGCSPRQRAKVMFEWLTGT